MEHKGDLHIPAWSYNRFNGLTKVADGRLEISEHGCELPNLMSVQGDLVVNGRDVVLPSLTSVGGTLWVMASGIQMPRLASIGRGLVLIEGVPSVPSLTSVGGHLFVQEGFEFDYSRIEFGCGKVIALSNFALHYRDGRYREGGFDPLTASEAIDTWSGRSDARAREFIAAINANESLLERPGILGTLAVNPPNQ